MWIIHYRVYTQGAWRRTSKTVKADSSAQAKVKADIWEGLIIKVERI
jgi:hypothetical protein